MLASSPALRRLFGRVIDAVGSAVAGMQDMNKMVPALTELGLRHASYNVKEWHFEVFEKVPGRMLRTMLYLSGLGPHDDAAGRVGRPLCKGRKEGFYE